MKPIGWLTSRRRLIYSREIDGWRSAQLWRAAGVIGGDAYVTILTGRGDRVLAEAAPTPALLRSRIRGGGAQSPLCSKTVIV
jgi:hypothetical protein